VIFSERHKVHTAPLRFPIRRGGRRGMGVAVR
jgi:hypothetical protein